VGNITHSSILVPYHGWRISHRTHHQNHGHVENDESWHPVAKHLYDKMVSGGCSGVDAKEGGGGGLPLWWLEALAVNIQDSRGRYLGVPK